MFPLLNVCELFRFDVVIGPFERYTKRKTTRINGNSLRPVTVYRRASPQNRKKKKKKKKQRRFRFSSVILYLYEIAHSPSSRTAGNVRKFFFVLMFIKFSFLNSSLNYVVRLNVRRFGLSIITVGNSDFSSLTHSRRTMFFSTLHATLVDRFNFGFIFYGGISGYGVYLVSVHTL